MSNTIERKLSDVSDELTVRLDDLEHSLPPIPSKALSVTRAGARRVNDVVGATVRSASSHASSVGETFGWAARSTSGQASAQARRAADTVSTGAKTVAGQAAAGATRTKDSVADEIESGLDEARVAVDPDDLSSLTKAELYDRAQDLDIDGRSGMSKAELVSAIQQS